MSAAPTIVGPIRRITCREFDQMIESGVFGQDEELELIDGVIVQLSPQGVLHSMAVSRIARWLSSVVDNDHFLTIQQPIQIDEMTRREPDLAIVIGNPAQYEVERRHPSAADVRLLIEVADSSVAEDSRRKHLLYSKSGVPEFWLLNLPDRRLEVHTEPTDNGYGLITILNEFHEVAPSAFASAAVQVIKLLPRLG